LSRQSEKLFGVKLNSNNISQVARGDKKSHKGYVFKYPVDMFGGVEQCE
jgi:hypothetical protein